MTRSVVWFRRDLRLRDHSAVSAGARTADELVALFVLDPRLLAGCGANRRTFLFRTLRALNDDLGGRLVVRTGHPAVVVPAVTREVGAKSVHVSAEYTPFGVRRDRDVRRALNDRGVQLVATGSPYAVAPGTIHTRSGTPFRVFTPFFRAWMAHVDIGACLSEADVSWSAFDSDSIPSDSPGHSPALPLAGEAAAYERLETALSRLGSYDASRDVMGIDGTTRLSPYLKVGTLHPAQVLARLGTGAGEERLRIELAWREFYADVLWSQPHSAWTSLQPTAASVQTDSGPIADARFRAWVEGRTGYPVVDAGMRQLRHEGWMHNRARMIAASFLVKDLHLPWQLGARYFLDHLVDGDVASNNHGWQWAAGTGTDAVPYVRVFNPTRQGERFDPDGAYVRRWIPEIAGLPNELVHRPWAAGPLAPADYPSPIVDHDTERRIALSRYEVARSAASTNVRTAQAKRKGSGRQRS